MPLERFWRDKGFKKKTWIEYNVLGRNSQDSRPESIKIDSSTIESGETASFSEIKKLMSPFVTTLDEMNKEFKSGKSSLGFVKPVVRDFIREEKTNKRMEKMMPQQTLGGKSAVRIDLIPEQLSYIYSCAQKEEKVHKQMCEDWELGALYRHYLHDTDLAFEKCKEKFLIELPKKPDFFFMIGTHFRWRTPMIISVLYPRKSEII
ncbi:MAG: hypothetical protein ACE5DI_03215 [Candidatus Micrarchaeia archaeon]